MTTEDSARNRSAPAEPLREARSRPRAYPRRPPEVPAYEVKWPSCREALQGQQVEAGRQGETELLPEPLDPRFNIRPAGCMNESPSAARRWGFWLGWRRT